jgi:Spy/CpxP family protein refolding chaperone
MMRIPHFRFRIGVTTMIPRTFPIITLVLVAAVAPLAAQQPDEQLQDLRMKRLREALRLEEDQAAAVAEAMEEVRRAEREGRQRERAALERLRSSLQADPVNQEAVREALNAIDAEREAIARVRREQADRLKQRLTPEQQAKLMLFNRQFEQRLRELMVERRGGPRMGRPGMGPGRHGLVPGRGRGRDRGAARGQRP